MTQAYLDTVKATVNVYYQAVDSIRKGGSGSLALCQGIHHALRVVDDVFSWSAYDNADECFQAWLEGVSR